MKSRKVRWFLNSWLLCRAEGDDGAHNPTPPENGGDGVGKGAEPVSPGSGSPPEPTFQVSDIYFGSKERNPQQRPLRIDTTGMSKEQVDAILDDADQDIYMSEEEAKEFYQAQKSAKQGTTPEGEPQKDDSEDPAKKESGQKEKETSVDDQVKAILDESGLTQEQFSSLSEKAQERIASAILGEGAVGAESAKLKEEFESYRKDQEQVMSDPIIAARLEELATGKSYVATKLDPVSEQELTELDALLADNKKAEALKKINEMIDKRAKDAVNRERGVVEIKAEERKLRDGVVNVLAEIGKIDKRFSLEESDLSKLNPSHKEWKKFSEGPLGELKQYCIETGLSMQDMVKMGPKQLLAAFSVYKGWDRERDNKLVEAGIKKVLEAIRNPKKVAHTLDQGRGPVHAMSGKSTTAFDRDALRASLIDGRGNSQDYDALLERFGDDPKVVSQLTSVMNDALMELRASR